MARQDPGADVKIDLCQRCLLDGLHGYMATGSEQTLTPLQVPQHLKSRVSMLRSFAACNCPT